VVIVELPTSDGADVAPGTGAVGAFRSRGRDRFGPTRCRLRHRAERAPLSALVHCAGRGGAVRVVERDGSPGSLEYIVTVNLIGTFNALRLAAACMARNELVDGDRGVCIPTASVSA
jgi:NAD(P)-dependent dehydrogenase (short-subunit alcohol dehydrogenase family)